MGLERSELDNAARILNELEVSAGLSFKSGAPRDRINIRTWYVVYSMELGYVVYGMVYIYSIEMGIWYVQCMAYGV